MSEDEKLKKLQIQTLFAVPRWIEAVTTYKDASILRQDFFKKDSHIRQAMEATNIEQLDLSLIGKVYKVVEEWLFKDLPLTPLEDDVLSQYSKDFERWDALSIYARIQPGVDVHGFGMPLVIATLPNSVALNNYLIELQKRDLDKDDDFRNELRSLVTNRRTAAEIEKCLGRDGVEGNAEYECVTEKALNAAGALLFVLSTPADRSNIQGVAGP